VIAHGLSVRELEELAKKSKKSIKLTDKDNKFIVEQYSQLKNKLEQNNSPRLNDAINIYSKPNSINKIKNRFSTKESSND
jgi:hypothetical protein